MNCERVQELLAGFVDGELSIKEHILVEKHISGCSSCWNVYSSMKQYQTLMQDMSNLHLNESFTPQLIESITAKKKDFKLLDDWKFAWSNFWSANRVAKASYGMATAVLLIVSVFTFQTVILDDGTTSEQNIAAEGSMEDNESPTGTVPIVLPPVPDENTIKAYRFDLNSNKIKTIMVKDGQEKALQSVLDESEYDKIFGHILYNRAMLEKRDNNETIAKNLFNRLLNDRFLIDQELKNKARVELTGYSTSP